MVITFGFIIAAFVGYFLPCIAAACNRHHNWGAITIVNVFLGWTLVGWVVALAWACTKSESQRVKATPPPIKPLPIPQPLSLPPEDIVDKLERLARLKEQGVLTEDEFQAQKAKILPIAAPSLAPPMVQDSTIPIVSSDAGKGQADT